MALTVAELESRFTANLTDFERGAQTVERMQKLIDGRTTTVKIDTNAPAAVQDIDRVEGAIRAIPDGAFTVDADTSGAQRAVDDLETEAGESGRDAGQEAGQGFSDEVIAALISIPIAGALIGVGAAGAKALIEGLNEGLMVEADRDRLMAQTGLDPTSVGILARAAGESYANNWGESVSANLDVAKFAIQGRILDPEATKADAQAVLEALVGVSDIVGEETQAVTRTVSTLLRTGLAKDAEEAFDIIVTGSREGLNQSEDLLDTLNEYSTQFRALGLTAPAALGLMRQAVEGGARDTDKAADALKEYAIRAVDGSDTTKDAFERLGLSVKDMQANVAAGGDSAASALDLTLDKLRDVEDPAERAAIAVGLFGTQSEDLQAALYGMDLSTAVEQLGNVEGAARTAMEQLSDNTASSVETAQRNIEVAATGIKGALAEAFAPQIEGFADTVTENREAVIGFLLDIANGALNMGASIVEGAAVGTEAVGGFVAGPLADLTDGLAGVLDGLDSIPGVETGDQQKSLEDLADKMRGFKGTAEDAAETLRTDLIENGIRPAQDRLNDVGDGLLADARVHDATTALARDLDGVGRDAEGAQMKLKAFDTELDTSSATGERLDEQLRAVADSMNAQAEASRLAGEDADSLRENLDGSRESLERQLEAMGLSAEEAAALADAYGLIPDEIITNVSSAGIDELIGKLATAEEQIRYLTGDHTVRVARGQGGSGGLVLGNAVGRIVEHQGAAREVAAMASGGILANRMEPIAQMVPPGTMRLVGDRMDVDEAYIPIDNSPRSMAILLDVMRRMGVTPMASGGVTGAPTVIPQSVHNSSPQHITIEHLHLNGDGSFEADMFARKREASVGGHRWP